MVRPVATEAATGGDRRWLDSIGIVQALKFSTSVNGDMAAQWQMILDPRSDHQALTPGRSVLIPVGAGFWRGILNNPRRGDGVWEFTADGAASLAAHYTALAPTSGNAYNLDEVVDAAIGRDLPWTRPSALTTTDGTKSSGDGTVEDVLNDVSTAENVLWRVDRDLQLTTVARPTNLAYLLMANDTAGGRSVQGFVTDVHVIYKDAADSAIKTVTRSSTSRPYGTFEQPHDVTRRGAISTTKANSIGDHYLARNGARLAFTGAFTIAPGQLLTIGGTPVDLATVQATDGLARILLTDPDTAAGELAYAPTDIIPGQTEYDEDSGVLTLTPLEVNPTGLAAVFS